MQQTDILLESGSNEVEYLEFNLGNQGYGVNVLKIKQILKYKPEDLSKPPKSNAALLGLLNIQGKQVPIIEIGRFFNVQDLEEDTSNKIVIVLEFNEHWYGFITDGVNKIHRFTWEDLQPLDNSMQLDFITATTLIQKRTILIVDFEKVVSVVFNMNWAEADKLPVTDKSDKVSKRKKLKIFFADDTALMREGINSILLKHHFENVTLFQNGKELHDHVIASVEANNNVPDIDLIITDVEMPKMDGLTVCKIVKERYPTIPVIILSSLISKQILTRCKTVNADAAISKKDLKPLVSMIDEITQ
ncbi:MAG: hypothetical protein COA79_05265 [Planctomycetota bacterium]|nr:MAG: hypothetical protein COA79_05265 [Planctomycetota bacterium]